MHTTSCQVLHVEETGIVNLSIIGEINMNNVYYVHEKGFDLINLIKINT
jgi:hypothetical protein